jgi:hypothetical protein
VQTARVLLETTMPPIVERRKAYGIREICAEDVFSEDVFLCEKNFFLDLGKGAFFCLGGEIEIVTKLL